MGWGKVQGKSNIEKPNRIEGPWSVTADSRKKFGRHIYKTFHCQLKVHLLNKVVHNFSAHFISLRIIYEMITDHALLSDASQGVFF